MAFLNNVIVSGNAVFHNSISEGGEKLANKYSGVGNIAPAFSTSTTYSKGDLVIYQGLLYKYINETASSGAWTASKWSQTSLGAEFSAAILDDVVF